MDPLINKDDVFYIPGHRGMVGSAVTRQLIKEGFCDSIEASNLILKTREELDLTRAELVSKFFKINKPDVVIICSAKVGGIAHNSQNPFDFLSENLKIQQNIIENAWMHGTRRLLFLGSSCIYPKLSKQPIVEEELLSKSLEKTNEYYALAKITGIKLCESLRIQYGFDTLALMPTNLYGPGDNYHSDHSHVMASLLKKFLLAKDNELKEITCWGDGSPLREFMHVDDLAAACIHVLKYWDPDSNTAPKDQFGNKLFFLNVGTGKDISIKNLTSLIAKEVEFEGKITWDKSMPNGTPKKQLNVSRLESIGWRPKISLESGIKMTIKELKYSLKRNPNLLKNF